MTDTFQAKQLPSVMEADDDEDLSLEIQVLRSNRKDFKRLFDPSDFIHHLKCLTETDDERILAKQNQEGKIMATLLMFETFARKRDSIWWSNFIQALRQPEHRGNYIDVADKLESDLARLQQKQIREHEVQCVFEGAPETYDLNMAIPPGDEQMRSNMYLARLQQKQIREHEVQCVFEGTVHGAPETYDLNMAIPPGDEQMRSNMCDLSLKDSLPSNMKQPHSRLGGPTFCKIANDLTSGKAQKTVNNPIEQTTRKTLFGFNQGEITLKAPHPGKEETLPKAPYPGEEETLPKIDYPREDNVADVVIEDEDTVYPDEKQTTPKHVVGENLDKAMNYDTHDVNKGVPGVSQRCAPLLPSVINPRKYQDELARRPLHGDNCIICAPTGCGKTLVAIMIAHDHLGKAEANVGNGQLDQRPAATKSLVIVLVPRFALLQQVYRDFRCHLPLVDIGKRGGGGSVTKKSLKSLSKDKDIVIVTADILKNALRDGTMALSDFTLMILDECHYTKDDHTYNYIMERYVRDKKEVSGENLPQIVGLTATPGAGKTIDVQSAKDSMLRLCANLDADYFITVQENQDELSKFTSMPTRHRIPTKSREENHFSRKLTECMEVVEKQTGFTGIPARGSQQYESLVVERKTQALGERRYELVTMCDHLFQLNKALTLFQIVRMKDALCSLVSFYIELKRRKTEGKLDETERWLLKMFTDCEPVLAEMAEKEKEYSNPKLDHLFHAILCHRDICRNKGLDLRMMIFVKTKQITLAILEWMKDDERLSDLNPAFFTGVRAVTEKGGMSTQDQKSVLFKFDKGEHKVLVSTSVGEEGIDIPACSIAIRYDHVTNEISMIQSRGRVRQQAGNEVIIGESNTLEKDQYNVMLEEVMIKAMETVTDMAKDEMRRQIRGIQNIAIVEREDKIRRREAIANTNQADDVRLLCKGCKVYFCNASDIRLYKNSNHILPDMKFRRQIEFREHPDKEKAKKYKIKKIHCLECGWDWGNTASHYPCIAIQSFIVEIHGEPAPKSFKKWKQVPFKIQEYSS